MAANIKRKYLAYIGRCIKLEVFKACWKFYRLPAVSGSRFGNLRILWISWTWETEGLEAIFWEVQMKEGIFSRDLALTLAVSDKLEFVSPPLQNPEMFPNRRLP